MLSRPAHPSALRASLVGLALLAVALLFGSCSRPPERPAPVILLGIDGADWGVIEQLWDEGKLPHLKSLVERGSRTPLGTGWGSRSPVIWTTIATGVVPERHGITDFVVTTPEGTLPISSAARIKPALWNMTTTTGRTIGVLGWWPSWPAEAIDGWMLSDRAHLNLDQRSHPPEWADEIQGLQRSEVVRIQFPAVASKRRDEMVALAAQQLLEEDLDLLMIYLKATDETSHHYWKYFRPEKYEDVDPQDLERFGQMVPDAYSAADELLGELLEARPDANFMVVSDHGFYGLKTERTNYSVDFDAVLERLGLLKYHADGTVDLQQSSIYTWNSGYAQRRKNLRIATEERGGTLRGPALANVENTLAEALERLRWDNGTPAAKLRKLRPKERDLGYDLSVQMTFPGSASVLMIDDAATGLVTGMSRLSGSHGGGTLGIFAAAGPDIRKQVEIRKMTVLDITPTVLFALGLPIAKDFDGRVVAELFTTDFENRFPRQTIATWGDRSTGSNADGGNGGVRSEADEQLIEELRVLGYL